MTRDANARPTPWELVERWEAQQEAYIRHRRLRFDTMLTVIERAGYRRPRVLDLASGPGSLTRAVLERFPEAEVVAVDKDPLLLAIARDTLDHDARITVVEADLDDPAWKEGLGREFDAALSSTALHWLQPEVLARLYLDLADVVAPAGLFLNGDHFDYDRTAQPELHRITQVDGDGVRRDAYAAGVDTWEGWWRLAEARPEYAIAAEERARRWEGRIGAPKVTVGFHLEALRSAGFSEVGTVWQYLDDYVVCAVR